MLDHPFAEVHLAVHQQPERDEIAVPVVELVEPRAGDDEGDALERLLARRRVGALPHGEGEDAWAVVQGLDEGRVARVGREELDLQVEMGLRLGAEEEEKRDRGDVMIERGGEEGSRDRILQLLNARHRTWTTATHTAR